MSQYNKFFLALYAGVLTWAGVVVASTADAITAPEWLGLAGGVGVALGVRQVPNTD